MAIYSAPATLEKHARHQPCREVVVLGIILLLTALAALAPHFSCKETRPQRVFAASARLPAAARRTIFVVYGAVWRESEERVYRKMQQELGAQRVFYLLDDTR